MLSRIRAIGASQAVDISSLEPIVGALDVGRPATVALCGGFSRLSITAPWPASTEAIDLERRRLDALGPGFAAQRGWIGALLSAEGRAGFVRIESIPHRAAVAFAARAVGERDVGDDLEFLVDHARVEPAVARQLEGLVAVAGTDRCLAITDRCGPPALHTWTLDLPMPWDSSDRRRAALSAADSLAGAFGISDAQRRLAAELHAFLQSARACTLSLVTSPDELLPCVELEYEGLRAQTALRVLDPLYPSHRCPTRIGALVTAASAPAIAALRLRLGAPDGIRAAISVELSRSPEPEARSPKPEARSPKPEAQTPKPEARSPKPAPDSGLELEKYAIMAGAGAVTASWPPEARAELAEFVMSATRADLPAVDGNDPGEVAANARALARYWYGGWRAGRDMPDGLPAPGGETAAAHPAHGPTPEIPAAAVAVVGDWAGRFGVAHAIDLWRAERGQT